MDDFKIIDLTPENFAGYGVCGYKDVNKHKELKNKLEWFREYYSLGLRIKIILSDSGGYQGMIEYLPGKYAHRPVSANDYMFIHCIFVGFRNEYKGKGYASALIEACIRHAKREKMKGVATLSRNGSFMAGSEIFLKNGFEAVDTAKPDFCLLVKRFSSTSSVPSFKSEVLNDLEEYKNGLTVFRSPQCPYTEKNVAAIIETAREKFNLEVRLIDLKNHEAAQATPCPFGTFCLVYNGKVISYHPISNKRFENIMTRMAV